MKLDGVSAIAVILIASFAIDRIVTGLLFLMSFSKTWTRLVPEPATLQEPLEAMRAEKKQKLAYFLIALPLGILVLGWYGGLRLFVALGFQDINYILDTFITGLVLVAGADRIAGLLKMSGAPGAEDPAPRPLEVTGRLTLEQGSIGSESPSER